MKKTFLPIFLAAAMLAAAVPAMACGDCADKKGCDLKKSSGCDESGGCPVTAKFFKKASFFLDNKDEIGLSEDQVKAIRALWGEVKRSSIRAKADMEVWTLDLMDKLSEPTVDTVAVGAMIDQGMAGFSSGAKATVDKYVQLKAVLSEAQMAKAKEIWGRK